MSFINEREKLWQKLDPKERDTRKHSYAYYTYYMDKLRSKNPPKETVLLESPFFRDAFKNAQQKDTECLRIISVLKNEDVTNLTTKERTKIQSSYSFN